MNLEEFKNLLETTGIPVAYYAFPEDESPGLPFICFLVSGSNNFAADGIVYKKIDHIQVELYTKNKDIESEEKVEKALSSFYWQKEEIYLKDERCFEVLYELEVLDGEQS